MNHRKRIGPLFHLLRLQLISPRDPRGGEKTIQNNLHVSVHTYSMLKTFLKRSFLTIIFSHYCTYSQFDRASSVGRIPRTTHRTELTAKRRLLLRSVMLNIAARGPLRPARSLSAARGSLSQKHQFSCTKEKIPEF